MVTKLSGSNDSAGAHSNRNFGLAESALQGLADLLTLEAGSIKIARAVENLESQPQSHRSLFSARVRLWIWFRPLHQL